ncbi:hypothetical protein U9M48_027400 [Paspalum notatum var. saurae]|uniref:Uncharacterized protein n=1 Tax=Paspalum notatum var. saurae TaxID=547442 RepID=A0AAQ3WZE6_PASNO
MSSPASGFSSHGHALSHTCRGIVGLGFDVPARLAAPVQQQLQRLGAGVEGEVDGGLDPAYLLAVRLGDAKIGEASSHDAEKAAAPTEEQGLELRVPVLHDDAEDQVPGQRRRGFLPFGDEVGGGLVHRPADGEHGDRLRHAHEAEFPRQDDAEALAAAAADGPEQVLPHGGPVQEPPVGVHEDGVEDVVSGEAVPAHQRAEPAAAKVAADADGGADPRGEGERAAGGADGVVDLAERGARPGPRLGARGVDADVAQRGEVQHREALARVEGRVGEALVVVPAAAGADADAVAAAAAHGGLRVGGLRGGHDGERARGGGRDVAEVADGGEQQRGIGRGRRGVEEAPRNAGGGEAADERVGGAGS